MAKPTKFVAACRKIQAAIDKSTATGTGSHKRRAALQRELALWATTFYTGDSYDRLSSLKGLPWQRWDTEMLESTRLLAAALRLMERHGFTRAKALTACRTSPADLDMALSLMKQAGLSQHEIVGEQADVIATLVESAVDRLHVNVEARALEDLLLAAAEGYKVSPGKGFKYTEVFGLCFGSVRRQVRRGKETEVFANVSRVATQLRAKGNASSVQPNDKSLAAQVEIGRQFFPYLEVLGDYHTHPFKSFKDLKDDAGWEHSDQDERSLAYFVEQLREREHTPVFSLVVAVASGGKSSQRPLRRARNVVQVPVGDLYFVIGCYRILLDASYDTKVDLAIPSLVR